MLLKPALRYAPQLHRIIGLEDPYFLTFQQVKDLCSRSEEDILKYLKSLDFVSEAQEFRIASLDGLISFSVGCFFRSSKGGAARIKGYDQETQESLQVCTNCLLSGSNCAVPCAACEEQNVVGEACVALGYDSTEPMRRKCKPCRLDDVPCTRMLEMSWVSDSEAAQRAHMTQLQRDQDLKVPIPDPSHVLKLGRSALFNYWTFIGKFLVSLKLLSCARGDADKVISKPIASVLPRSCLRNKDQMDMNTAVAIFHKELLNSLPNDPVVATLIPEHDRSWRQNPADSLLKFPSAITFSPKHSLLFICDKKKSTIFMANLHNPVCVVPVVGPKSRVSSPQGIVVKDDKLVVLASDRTSYLKIIDIKSLLNKSRTLLQLDTNDDEDATEPVAASSSTSNPGKVKVYDVCFRSNNDYEKTDLGRVVSMTTNPSSEGEELSENTSILLLSFDKKTIFKASNFTFALDQKCYNADVEILLELTTGQPLCIYQDPQSLLVSLHNYGIKRIRWQNGALLMSSVLKKKPSSILGIGRTEEKLVFSDCQDHTVNFFFEEESRITYSLGTVQGFQDGYTVAFKSPSSLVAFGETVFVCDTSKRALRIITSLTTYRLLGEKMDSFIDLFQLREDSGNDYVNHQHMSE